MGSILSFGSRRGVVNHQPVELSVESVSPRLEFSLENNRFGSRALNAALKLRPIEEIRLRALIRHGKSACADVINIEVTRYLERFTGVLKRYTQFDAFKTLVELQQKGLVREVGWERVGNFRRVRFAASPIAEFFDQNNLIGREARPIKVKVPKVGLIDYEAFSRRPSLNESQKLALGLLSKNGQRGAQDSELKRELFKRGLPDFRPSEHFESLGQLGMARRFDHLWYLTDSGRVYQLFEKCEC